MTDAALPVNIRDHVDGCSCTRCDGLEVCPVCSRQKLDIDWCFECRRLMFFSSLLTDRPAPAAAPTMPP